VSITLQRLDKDRGRDVAQAVSKWLPTAAASGSSPGQVNTYFPVVLRSRMVDLQPHSHTCLNDKVKDAVVPVLI
jgi:hypothetical protein